MKCKIRILLTWLLICSLTVEGLVPVFGQDNIRLNDYYNKYKATYKEYNSAVAGGASLETIQQKFNDYMAAYSAYQKEVQPLKGSISNYSTDNSSTSEAQATSTSAETSVSSSSATVGGQSSTDNSAPTQSEIKSIFGQIFAKVKETLLGKKGVKQMPLWEKVLWNIGKALVPSLGVMLATAFLAPLSPIAMIAGGIIVGAALGGALTYAYEKRMNAKYRDVPKEDAKIWRDVTVTGAVEAVMAPFNLATGGLFGMVGPTVGSAIGRVALTQAALSFAGTALSSAVGGSVKHLWAKYYFQYPEKIEADEKKIDAILYAHLASGQPLTEAETQELDGLRSEIDTMKDEDYNHQDFVKDIKRAAMSATISGFLGSVVSDRLYTYESGRWADRLSVKVFGSVSQGKAISSLVSTMPVNFLGGMAGAALEKSFINQDIEELRQEQKAYSSDSAAYQYYERSVAQLEEKKNSISEINAGINNMGNNAAVRAAQLSVQALKYNLVDAPAERRKTVDERYRANDPEWKKASDLYEKYQESLSGIPNISKIRNPVAYAKAQAAYLKQVESARREWLSQCVAAQEAESLPQNQAIKTEIQTKYTREVKLNQILELGRLEGGEAHILAMKEVLKSQQPELASGDDNELTRLACQAIRETYNEKYVSCGTRVQEMESVMKKYDDYKAGQLKLSEKEAQLLEGQRALISPSQYKAAVVEQKVYELKNTGEQWNQIRKNMPTILSDADNQMLSKYGGNWIKVIGAETYANGLARYKYNPDGTVPLTNELKKTLGSLPGMVENEVVTDYNNRVNEAIIGNILPQANQDDSEFEDIMKTYAKTAFSGGTNTVINTILQASKDQILSNFKR